MLSSQERLPLLAPEQARHAWIHGTTQAVVVLGGAYQIFLIASAPLLGFSVSDAAIAILYAGLVALLLVRAQSETVALYTLAGFAMAQIPAFLDTGFAGASSLLPCTLPVLATLFFGLRAAYVAMASSLLSFSAIGLLRLYTDVLPPANPRLVDPRLPLNWIGVAIALSAVAGPVVWLATRITGSLDASTSALARAQAVQEAQVHLRIASETALAKATERRQGTRQVEAAGLLISGAVHDLRNSLSVLQLWSGSLRKHSSVDPVACEALGRIDALCRSANALTQEFLMVARTGSGRPESHGCRLVEQVRAAATTLRAFLPADISVSVVSELAGDVTVLFDGYALTSAILELASHSGHRTDGSVRIVVREPDHDEHEALYECAAVVELAFGLGPAAVSDVLADEIAQQGGRLLAWRQGEGGEGRPQGVLRLLLPSGPDEPRGIEQI